MKRSWFCGGFKGLPLPLRVQFSLFSCSFWWKLAKILRLRDHLWCCAPVCRILDPLLVYNTVKKQIEYLGAKLYSGPCSRRSQTRTGTHWSQGESLACMLCHLHSLSFRSMKWFELSCTSTFQFSAAHGFGNRRLTLRQGHRRLQHHSSFRSGPSHRQSSTEIGNQRGGQGRERNPERAGGREPRRMGCKCHKAKRLKERSSPPWHAIKIIHTNKVAIAPGQIRAAETPIYSHSETQNQ